MALPDWHYIANVWITDHIWQVWIQICLGTAEEENERASCLVSELASKWERKHGSDESDQLIRLGIVLVLNIIRDNSPDSISPCSVVRKFVCQISFSVKKMRCAVHPTDGLRKMYGEFHHLFWQLQNHSGRVFKYLRTSVETFDFLLNIVNHCLQKETAHYRQHISHAERLLLTIM